MRTRLIVTGLDGQIYILPTPTGVRRPRCECRACDVGDHPPGRACDKTTGIKTYRRASDGEIERLCVGCAHEDLMADFIEEVERCG